MDEIMERVQELQKQLNKVGEEEAHIKGKIEAVTDQLKEVGCKSVGAAKKMFQELSKELDELDIEIEEKLDEYESKFGELI